MYQETKYSKRLKTSYVKYLKWVRDTFPAPNHFLHLGILKNVAILIFEIEAILSFMYQFLSANGLAAFDTYEAETAADAIIWNVFARKSADFHEFCHSLSLNPF